MLNESAEVEHGVNIEDNFPGWSKKNLPRVAILQMIKSLCIGIPLVLITEPWYVCSWLAIDPITQIRMLTTDQKHDQRVGIGNGK